MLINALPLNAARQQGDVAGRSPRPTGLKKKQITRPGVRVRCDQVHGRLTSSRGRPYEENKPQEFAMKTLKKLHAKVRSWVKGGSRRKPTRQARLGLETLEQRDVPSVTAPITVLGTDGKLWLEAPGWQTTGRTWIDSNVRSFAYRSDGYYDVLHTDGNLYKEKPGWNFVYLNGNNPRIWIDSNVRSYAYGSDTYDYVLDTNGNLWLENLNGGTHSRTWVDGNVQSFAHGNDGYDYVLGTNGNLWQETPLWQHYGRTLVDWSVHSF